MLENLEIPQIPKNLKDFGCKNALKSTNQISQHFSQFFNSHFLTFLICGLKSLYKTTYIRKQRFPQQKAPW